MRNNMYDWDTVLCTRDWHIVPNCTSVKTKQNKTLCSGEGTKVQWNRIELPEIAILHVRIYDKGGI